jgi:phenylglyoxylate dehydrogenase epsilon subunit
MAHTRHLIIGSGMAALSALERIRKFRPDDEIKMVTMEDCLPYSPASLPYLLVGRIKERDLWLRNRKYFKQMKTTFVGGKEVVEVRPEAGQVVYQNGGVESYDDLLIATGAEPVRPPIDGLDQAGVHTLRTLADCRALQVALKDAKKVAILGAGLVGIKIAAALLEKGYEVELIEREQAILPLYFDEEAGACIRDILSDHGGNLLTGRRVAGVGRQKKGKIVIECAGSGSITADVLINAAGVRSRIPAMDGAGIKRNKGILVDAGMRTGSHGVYAAGDVAETSCFFTGQSAGSAIIPSAVAQGALAGANMSGQNGVYEGSIAMTAVDIFGNRAYSIGLINPPGKSVQVIREKDPAKRQYKRLIFDGDRLVGAMGINERIDPGIVLHLIKKKVNMAIYKQALIDKVRPLTDPWLASLRG